MTFTTTNALHFKCPGKVFILGEYACLQGGGAILIAPQPFFSLTAVTIQSESTDLNLPFALKSPAGLFLSQHTDLLKNIKLQWHDPYTTPIGVGSSSAQFVLSVQLINKLQNKQAPDVQEVLELYWKTVGDTQGLRPSGLDVVTQWIGAPIFCYWDQESTFKKLYTDRLNSIDSTFKFVLAYTGAKTRTHEHLKSLQEAGFPKGKFTSSLNELNLLTSKGARAWKNQDFIQLGNLMNGYQQVLTQAEIAPENFTKQVVFIQNIPGVIGAKGSGAQGGDCVLILIRSQALHAIQTEIQKIGWQVFDV